MAMLSLRAAIFLLLLAEAAQASEKTKKCKLSVNDDHERKVLNRLEPFTNKNFTATQTVEKQFYTYEFRLCDDAMGMKEAGVVQIDQNGKKVRIGNYTATGAIAGSDWIMLTYWGGEKYDLHCTNEARRAIIMISCNKSATMDFTMIQEVRQRDFDCFYMFELDTNLLCPVVQSKLSPGSILLIIGFSCLAVYLIGGFLYQRLVVGAKGVDQFPNYAFWSEIGNLSADGCDFICRSRGNREEAPAYRGVAPEPLEEPEERDDRLLPM